MAAPDVLEQDAPQVFGRYLLLKRLSRGGMGEIFLAKLGEIQGFEKLVIIKKILPHLVADEEFIKRFIDEAKVAIKLNHANIAPVFEVGKVEGEYFLALQYVEGRDLRRMISRLREESARLPTDLCLYMVRELANGLAYAHRRNDDEGNPLALVHCDISPPNVMASFDGEVKIIDFGIAKSALRIAGSNPNVGFGKFGYMAPEQLLRGGVIDRRTDIYAAGVVLYELLTGERLFQFKEGTEYREMARAVTQGKFQSPSVRDSLIDPELNAICMKALATKKENRYQIAEDFRDALQAKLYHLSPTISADSLAHYMRGLFREELSEQHQLVANMKAVDIAPFRQELTVQHTVTFARAPGELASGKDAVRRSSTDPLDRDSRRFGLVAYLFSAVLIFGAAGTLYWMMRPKVQPKVQPNVLPGSGAPVAHEQPRPILPVVTPTRPAVPEQPAPPPPTPIVTQLPPPREPTSFRPHHRPIVAPIPVVAPPHLLATPESIQAKFRQVRIEYNGFKTQYGAVLEEKWNAITFEITYGKGDKFARVDAMLDALRRDMSLIKAGG